MSRKPPGSCTIIPINTQTSLPDPPPPVQSIGTHRTFDPDELEANAFELWNGGERPKSIVRILGVGENFIDDAIRGNVTPIRRKRAA